MFAGKPIEHERLLQSQQEAIIPSQQLFLLPYLVLSHAAWAVCRTVSVTKLHLKKKHGSSPNAALFLNGLEKSPMIPTRVGIRVDDATTLAVYCFDVSSP